MPAVRPLSKELQELAIKEIRENPDDIEGDLQHMRKWIKEQEHLKVRTDDQWLLNLLRGCRFKLERAKKKIEAQCAVKVDLPQYFENRDPLLPEIQELLKLGVILPLKKSNDPTAPRVVLTRRSGADPSKISPDDFIKLGSMIIDILYGECDNYVIAGSILVADNKDASMNYAHLYSPTEAKTVYTCFRDAYALRPRGVYLINTPGFIETIYNSVKSWVPKFLQDMVHIYSESEPEEMYETVPRSIMPEEYGGEGGTLEELTAEWKAKVESYRSWFLEDERYCLLERELPEETGSSWLGMGWVMGKLSFE